MNQHRVGYVDIYRGIGILCMIVGHVSLRGTYSQAFDQFIHAFHMPMFFFLSGYFFRTNCDIRFFCVKKFKTLMVPYIVFGLTDLLLLCLIDGQFYKGALLYHLPFENSNGLRQIGAIWFLTATFFASIIYYYISTKCVKQKVLQHILVICVSLGGTILPSFLPFRLPWSLDAAFVAVGFYHVGYLVQRYKTDRIIHSTFASKWPYTLGMIVLDVALIFQNGYINMRTGAYANVVLFWLNAFLSIVVLWNISRELEELMNWFIILKGPIEFVKYVGKNSITFLVTNQIVIYVLEKLFRIDKIPVLLQDCIILILALVIISCFDELICKTKMCVILGKRPTS